MMLDYERCRIGWQNSPQVVAKLNITAGTTVAGRVLLPLRRGAVRQRTNLPPLVPCRPLARCNFPRAVAPVE